MKVLGVFVVVLMAGVLGVAAIAGGGSASGGVTPGSGEGVGDIPNSLVGVYVAAAGACPGLPWTVLAAIGSIESGHGEGRADPSTGDVRPPILGPALDGRSGFARIPDPTSTDGWAHAQGPMQFLPDTWRRWGRLAPGRPAGAGASPHNAWDAIWTAAAYLCGSAGRVSDVRAAVRSYNHSDAYVNKVLAKAAEYEAALQASPVGANGMVCPVAAPVRHSNDWHAPRSGGRQHQGNDVFAPYGSVLVAIEDGVVDKSSDVESGLGGITLWIRGSSGTRWYYAHNARNLVPVGTRVVAGQPVALLGNTGNARTTPAHLHFEMHPGGGGAINPYPLIAQLCAVAT
jgi:hypothetical protein